MTINPRFREGLALATQRLGVGGEQTSGLPTYWYRAEPNFGDAISPIVTAWLLGRHPLWVSRPFTGKILGTGSVIDAARRGDVILGSGSIEDARIDVPRDVLIAFVRGPRTLTAIGRPLLDIPFADPAQLLPLLVLNDIGRSDRIGIIPHLYETQRAGPFTDGAHCYIDVRRPWRDVVSEIRSCRTIVSSSLHGIIVAEAFGVPAVWVAPSKVVRGGRHKFDDYYVGTGRSGVEPVGLEQAIQLATQPMQQPPPFDPSDVLEAVERVKNRALDRCLPEWILGEGRAPRNV